MLCSDTDSVANTSQDLLIEIPHLCAVTVAQDQINTLKLLEFLFKMKPNCKSHPALPPPSAGLSVTAVFSVALCYQSWQMCSGTDMTRPNLEPWSETFAPGPEESLCPLLLSPLSLTTTHRQLTTSSLMSLRSPTLVQLGDWTRASPLPKLCPPSF